MLSAAEKATLAQICDTFVPSLPPTNADDPRLFRIAAADLNVVDTFEQVIFQVTSEEQQRLFRYFLRAVESAAINRVIAGQPRPFSQLALDERMLLLHTWANSRVPLARQAFQSVKRLSLALFYATMPAGQPNPTWPLMQYADPPGAASDTPRPIKPLTLTEPTTLYADVLIIGSGAGGGVVAGELSAAGHDVLVVEKGDYYAEADFHGREYSSSEQMYERRALLTTHDLSINVLAGSVLGGGTTINWTTSLRPAEYVLNEWRTQYGFSGAASREFQESLDAVSARIHVTTEESAPNALNSRLEVGCRALGYQVEVLPRNVRSCEDCGFCGYGCPFGAKQSTLKTYLQDAHDRGARILVNAHVDRITVEHGRATGATIAVKNGDTVHHVQVKAGAVVVAAGSLHTPALLLRSGLGNAHIGANLHLHPTTMISSRFDEPIQGWCGAPQTRMCREFINLDGRGYGVWLETAPIHPGLAAQAFNWYSGRDHKRQMQNIDHFANIIVLTRDYHGGQVTIDKQGQPVLHYRLHRADKDHLLQGLIAAIKIHAAAGALAIYSPQQCLPGYIPDQNGDLNSYLRRVRNVGLERNAFALFSAHQMSTCRIAGSSALGAVNPAGEMFEVKNLFVADGSVLPTAVGVNPMLTIMGTAHYLAQQIKCRL